jgi:serine O-acetyltransferase
MSNSSMNGNAPHKRDTCRLETEDTARYHMLLPKVVEGIVTSCDDRSCYSHIDFEPIPSREVVVKIIGHLRDLLFPGYFGREKLDPISLGYSIGLTATTVFDLLSEQIALGIRHDCYRYDEPCSDCADRGHDSALALLRSIPEIRKTLAVDVRATFEGDPAARNLDEIIFSYPGLQAIYVYRLAHRLHELGVPLLPRIMTEWAHVVTGIDIHPAAEIGEGFVVDHGTGVVIGETVRIGKYVRVYQGVTLGALSLPKGCGDRFRGVKRHPTIEDEVIIYAGATILGGDTVIGARSVIGGNVWITESVPPDTMVLAEPPRLTFKTKEE